VRNILEVKNLTIHFKSDFGVVKAVDNVSFNLAEGSVLGLVGESGSGKSVLVRAILGLTPAESISKLSGEILFDGVDLLRQSEKQLNRDVRGKRISMVFQDPMTALNPVMTIGQQVSDSMRIHLNLTARQARARALDLLNRVGIPKPAERLDSYPHQLSGGMRQRVVIAIALSCEPDILLADEPTTALDVTVQAQILDLLEDLKAERKMSMILVSHDLGLVSSRADTVAVMYAGGLAEIANADTIFESPRMPYTRGLLDSIPDIKMPSHTKLKTIPGRPPQGFGVDAGCRFEPRCARAIADCKVSVPLLSFDPADSSHGWACFNPIETGGESR
jgi:oligopeptide/dipeptide ABC transporter ATP-binding protein